MVMTIKDVSTADARLIAAAPELAAALRKVTKQVRAIAKRNAVAYGLLVAVEEAEALLKRIDEPFRPRRFAAGAKKPKRKAGLR